MDQGVCSNFLGSAFWHFLGRLPGSNKKEQVKALFLRVLEFYDRVGTESRFQDLIVLMIAQPMKGPKLRAKAAEARGLVPFVVELCLALATQRVFDQTILQAAHKLQSIYQCLSVAAFDHAVYERSIREFLVLYSALNATNQHEKCWKVKPKLHLLAWDLSCHPLLCPGPTETRILVDWLQSSAGEGGATNSPLSTGAAFLLKFLAQTQLPLL
jgi:hypothetical protein